MLPCTCDHPPSIEEAAQHIRAHLYPVISELDLTDYEDRASMPTAKWLKEQNGVEITAITPAP